MDRRGVNRRFVGACGAALVALGLFLPSAALAHFDVVSLYQEKVKGFEAVYFLEKDEAWHRDRRIFEAYGQWDKFGDYNNMSGGLLFNIRPDRASQIQLSLFSMFSGNQLAQTELRNWEMLHGARLTIANWVELSAGGHWRQIADAPEIPGIDPERRGKMEASGFFELNVPIAYVRSSYVVGLDSVRRMDVRAEFNECSVFDSVGAGVIRYNYNDVRWMGHVYVERLGHPKFRFFTTDVRFGFWGFSDLRTGFDYILGLDEDFNSTRRGHFGTSFTFRAFYNYMDTANLNIFGSPASGRRLHGFTGEFAAQVPAKWVLTAISIAAAAYSGKDEDIDNASKMLENTIEHPEDEFFSRVSFTYSYNDPDSFALPVPNQEDEHRFFVTLSFIY